ncbi:MAG: hypothetical protein M0Q26_10010 [Chitinophagaceae bacterium]|nr:hypothetical protein [Chitinophagaceae bacterium]
MNLIKQILVKGFFLFFLNGLALTGITQTAMPNINSPVPVSPNAASLGKYGEVPVGYSTGIPNISIPVYEIQSGGLKIPVSLSYHAGGMKVEEVASWVGLGWSLNSGGIITRQVRGIADESPSGGYLQSYNKIDSFINNQMSSGNAQSYLDAINDGTIDSQQDIFTYNLVGDAGKFVFQPGGTVISIPVTKNKFEFGTYFGQDSCWKVTGTNGTIYYFTSKENTSASSVTNGSLGSTSANITSWYLTKMISPSGIDTVSFVYDGTFTQFNSSIAQTKYVLNSSDPNCTGKTQDDAYSLNNILTKRLSQINFRNGYVGFYAKSAERVDYLYDHAIDSIVISNTDHSFYKKYQFYQSYNTGSSSIYGTPTEELKRMFLDSVTIFDLTGRVNSYKFTYNQSTTFPSRNSYNQDHWGYSNGASNSVDFAPSYNIAYNDSNYAVINGANRNTDTVYNQLGILQSITYPTGGRTDFEFETNKIVNLSKSQDFVTGYDNFSTTTSYSGSFNINDDYAGTGGVNATISINNGGGACAFGASLGCPVVTLSGPSGSFNIFDNIPARYLQKGSYAVTVDLSGVTDPNIIANFSFDITWGKSAFSDSFFKYNANVGGLRIKKITNYSASGVKADVKKYTYKNPDTLSHSSGYLVSFPNYIGYVRIYNQITYPSSIYYCDYITISSGSNYPLLTSQGSYVGYKYVQELLGENGEFGKNEYVFTAPDGYPDSVLTNFPFAPSNTHDWKRGQLLHSKKFRYNSGSQVYELVDENINNYTDYPTNSNKGLKIGKNEIYTFSHTGNNSYVTSAFTTTSGWFSLASETHRTYDQNNFSTYTESVRNYGYGSNHYQPIALTTTNSKGENVVHHMKYPLDYAGLSGSDDLTAGIKNLQNKNVVSPVIEQYTQLGSDSRTTQAAFTSYKPNIPLPDTIYTAELAASTTSFSASSVSSGSVTKSSLYKSQVSLNKYDAYGNIVEQQELRDVKHTYLWDYQSMYPVAGVSNADSAGIAYTSFEADGTGNWSGISSGSVVSNASSPTGGKYYTLTESTIQKTGLSSGVTYIVSYWSSTGTYYTVSGTGSSSKTGASIGGWTYCEHEVTGATSIGVSGTGSIDELRLYPKGSLMTTYTYLPLTGMTSQCDAGNKITYYEYDSQGRLLQVKDEKRKILKTNTYQYQ